MTRPTRRNIERRLTDLEHKRGEYDGAIIERYRRICEERGEDPDAVDPTEWREGETYVERFERIADRHSSDSP